MANVNEEDLLIKDLPPDQQELIITLGGAFAQLFGQLTRAATDLKFREGGANVMVRAAACALGATIWATRNALQTESEPLLDELVAGIRSELQLASRLDAKKEAGEATIQ